LKIQGGSRLEVSELEVLNAVQKGIHANGWYEINMHNIRCNVDLDVKCPAGSIGLHLQTGDSIVHTTIGHRLRSGGTQRHLKLRFQRRSRVETVPADSRQPRFLQPVPDGQSPRRRLHHARRP